jgi:hypothetical protein
MKTLFVIILAVLLTALIVPGETSAQTLMNPANMKSFFYPVATGKTYVANQIDTSAVIDISGVSRLSLRTTSNDSTAYITNVDYRISPSSAWVATVADTVAVTAGGAVTYRSWVLRDNTVEKIAGVSGQIRIRKVFSASNIGVTTPTYTDQLFWRP